MIARKKLLQVIWFSRKWFCLLGLLYWAAACGPKQEKATDSAAPRLSPTNGATATSTVKETARFDSLKGKWLRPDGDYMLEITSVDAEGKMTAGYFNPRPISISQARAFFGDGKMRAIIELRDTGYPGCIYNLAYESGRDELVGTYFQAAMGETYEIRFTRLKQ